MFSLTYLYFSKWYGINKFVFLDDERLQLVSVGLDALKYDSELSIALIHIDNTQLLDNYTNELLPNKFIKNNLLDEKLKQLISKLTTGDCHILCDGIFANIFKSKYTSRKEDTIRKIFELLQILCDKGHISTCPQIMADIEKYLRTQRNTNRNTRNNRRNTRNATASATVTPAFGHVNQGTSQLKPVNNALSRQTQMNGLQKTFDGLAQRKQQITMKGLNKLSKELNRIQNKIKQSPYELLQQQQYYSGYPQQQQQLYSGNPQQQLYNSYQQLLQQQQELDRKRRENEKIQLRFELKKLEIEQGLQNIRKLRAQYNPDSHTKHTNKMPNKSPTQNNPTKHTNKTNKSPKRNNPKIPIEPPTWACDACTFKNPMNASQCEICDKPRT